MAKKRGLGMGLGALIQGDDSVNVANIPSGGKAPTAGAFFGESGKSAKASVGTNRLKSAPVLKNPNAVPIPGVRFEALPLSSIITNPNQPRKVFDEDKLNELAASIKEFDVQTPIRVREVLENGLASGKYEIIAGERRYRASKIAKIKEIPAIIADVKDDNLFAEALTENIQREDLNPLEVAAGYRLLLDDWGVTQEKLATRIGKNRSSIANTLRLLTLPQSIQDRIAAGVLSEGHARSLVALKTRAQQEELASRIVNEGMSVRTVEEEVSLLQGRSGSNTKARTTKAQKALPPQAQKVQEELSDYLDTVVQVKYTENSKKGQIVINFADLDDLKRIQSAVEND